MWSWTSLWSNPPQQRDTRNPTPQGVAEASPAAASPALDRAVPQQRHAINGLPQEERVLNALPQCVSIKYTFEPCAGTRRSLLPYPPCMQNLLSTLAQSYPDHANAFHFRSGGRNFPQIRYTDADGDRITITNDLELVAAISQSEASQKTLHLNVQPAPTPAPSQAQQGMGMPVPPPRPPPRITPHHLRRQRQVVMRRQRTRPSRDRVLNARHRLLRDIRRGVMLRHQPRRQREDWLSYGCAPHNAEHLQHYLDGNYSDDSSDWSE